MGNFYTCIYIDMHDPRGGLEKTYIHTWCTALMYLCFAHVTKVVRNEEVCAAARRQIFDTVGFTFINRLLASGCHACAKLKSVPESMNVLRV